MDEELYYVKVWGEVEGHRSDLDDVFFTLEAAREYAGELHEDYPHKGNCDIYKFGLCRHMERIICES